LAPVIARLIPALITATISSSRAWGALARPLRCRTCRGSVVDARIQGDGLFGFTLAKVAFEEKFVFLVDQFELIFLQVHFFQVESVRCKFSGKGDVSVYKLNNKDVVKDSVPHADERVGVVSDDDQGNLMALFRYFPVFNMIN
jgi:hypothetical protein